MDKKTQYCKEVNSPQIDYRFKANIIIITREFSLEIEADSKIYREIQLSQNKPTKEQSWKTYNCCLYELLKGYHN